MKDKTTVNKPKSLKLHKANRASDILLYLKECLAAGEKIDKNFLKELGEIA